MSTVEQLAAVGSVGVVIGAYAVAHDTGLYVRTAQAVDRLHDWLSGRPTPRTLAVSDRLIPAPEPAELEEPRPVDIDDCTSCEGTGMVEIFDWVRLVDMIWVTCTRCGGTGERGAACAP